MKVNGLGLLLGFGPSDMAEWLNGLLPRDFYSAHLKRVGWPSMVNGPLLFILKIKNTKENTSKVTRKTIMYRLSLYIIVFLVTFDVFSLVFLTFRMNRRGPLTILGQPTCLRWAE